MFTLFGRGARCESGTIRSGDALTVCGDLSSDATRLPGATARNAVPVA